MRFLIAFIFLFASVFGFGQQTNDTIQKGEEGLFAIHSPKKATIRSAILPGWGQAYNKKYWKMPIVYAGLGTCAGFIVWNHRAYTDYKTNFIATQDDDPSTVNTSIYDATNLERLMIQRSKWRDISYMSLAGVYILNIIDANVDGHLYHFDVNQDLSLRVAPVTGYSFNGIYSGLTISLNFK